MTVTAHNFAFSLIKWPKNKLLGGFLFSCSNQLILNLLKMFLHRLLNFTYFIVLALDTEQNNALALALALTCIFVVTLAERSEAKVTTKIHVKAEAKATASLCEESDNG